MKFEWNIVKEQINIKKHGITFEQASYVFSDPFALNQFDDEHSEYEDRWIILGKSSAQMILVTIHTIRSTENTEIVRIISARKATKSEQKTYQKRCEK